MTMTLTEAIAEVKPRGPFWPGQYAVEEPIAVILNAVASGDLIPASDARLAVALAYQRAADKMDPVIRSMISRSEAYAAILALANSDDLAEVEALKADRDAAREALMKAGIALHVAKREATDAEAEVARLTGENAELRADYYSAKERLAEYDRTALTRPKWATNAPQEPTEQQ